MHPFLLAAMLAVSPVSPLQMADTTEYERVFWELMDLAPDPSATAAISGVTLIRDAATIILEQGTLSLLSPVSGRRVGAVFEGTGWFMFAAPTAVERGQLRRFFEVDRLRVPLQGAVLLFADSTAQQLAGQAAFGSMAPDREAAGDVRESLEYISDDDNMSFDWSIMSALLNGRTNDLFYAHIFPDGGDQLFFMVDPYSREEVSLSRPAKGTPDEYRETISRFNRASDRVEGGTPPSEETVDVVRLDNYTIESTIANNLDFSATAAFDVRALGAARRWIPLTLYSELEVDSARWDDGSTASYFRGDESGTLWVDLGRDVPADSARRLTVHYQGDLMERVRDWMVYVRSSSGWYPRYGGRVAATFDLTFHTPARYAFVSVGEKITDEIGEDRRTSRWVTPAVRSVTFNLGEFEEHEFTDPRIPPVTLHVAQQAHEAITGQAALNNQYIPLQANIGEMVGADLANSLAFYQRVFGPAPVEQFIGTEIPYLHGEAFPGVVLLSWVTFQWTADKGYDDIFRAHEVAHQWWGIGVDFATYRDRWLSEGLSDFSGLWYMESIRMDQEMYEKRLIEMKDEILARRDHAGPIALGDRVASSEYPEDYQTIIYKKGAWVMHMLRYLMRDLDTMDETLFVETMQDFYASYLGKKATTEDFQEVVERHVGASMDWFFDQWVRGTEIPAFHVAYRYEDTPEGKVRATVRVRQENVSDGFRSYVPLFIDFGADGFARVRLLIDRPVGEYELPLLPKKPDRIVFNDFEAVLADVDYEGWD